MFFTLLEGSDKNITVELAATYLYNEESAHGYSVSDKRRKAIGERD